VIDLQVTVTDLAGDELVAKHPRVLDRHRRIRPELTKRNGVLSGNSRTRLISVN
jgi:hypothetical protein